MGTQHGAHVVALTLLSSTGSLLFTAGQLGAQTGFSIELVRARSAARRRHHAVFRAGGHRVLLLRGLAGRSAKGKAFTR
jgi:hypothetical protein